MVISSMDIYRPHVLILELELKAKPHFSSSQSKRFTMGSLPISDQTDSIAPNNLLSNASQNQICTAFGIKISPDTSIIHIAKAAGYDSLFIDLEHTALTIKDANQLCITANSAGITPFVRVPHQCGDGFIQKVLDVGAMGVIVPHIHGTGMTMFNVHLFSYSGFPTRCFS